jgi:hypothetical protein
MPESFSNEVKSFIFAHVDSVSFLETLLLLYSNPSRSWTAASLAAELRGNPSSIEQYLAKLKNLGFIRAAPDEKAGSFAYAIGNSQRDFMLQELTEAYRVKRHRVLECILSPMKRARDFADSFRVKKDEGGSDA